MNDNKIILNNKTHQKPMRDILGINNIPRINSKPNFNFETPLFRGLNLKHVRFHDCALQNPGHQLLDVSRIFPLLHLDENDPKNYFFAQTDDYLSTISDMDAEIDFRLGESIDHSLFGRLIKVPDDIDKWARVCRKIIGHYMNGEMDGMHLNITRITVWEEPDNNRLFGGTVEDYSKMFCSLYKIIKKDFPHIKIGGPCHMNANTVFLEKFIEICKGNGVIPDFVGGTMYNKEVEIFTMVLDKYRDIFKRQGIEGMKQTVVEWHLAPMDWDKPIDMTESGFNSAQNASFTVSSLIDFMNQEDVEVAYYYCWSGGNWSPVNCLPGNRGPYPVYYGLIFFQKMAQECTQRLYAENLGDIRVLAGRTDDGKTRVLISGYNVDASSISVPAMDASTAKLYTIADPFDEKMSTEGEIISAQDGEFVINNTSSYSVYLLEF